ncbi:MAG: hypothetical protein ACYC45_03790 [Acidithiobacillus ferriphilus]
MRKLEYEPVGCQSDPLLLPSLANSTLGHRHLAVMWYGALHINHNDSSQPLASVLLHDVKDNTLFGEFRCTKVSALNLGLLPIGSVWHEGKIVAKAKLTRARFEVDFSNDGWEHYFLNGDKSPLIPASVYPLFWPCKNEIADAWMLRFSLANNKTLIIPSLEFFTRCYGSSRLRRSFLTLPWNEVESRLFPKPEEQIPDENPNEWTIYLSSSHTKSDAHLLSHIKYNSYARLQTQNIVAQNLSSDPNHRLFLKVAPWTNKKGEIDVAGFYINETRTFVALNILGMGLSDYPQYVIYKSRTAAKKPDDEATTSPSANFTSQPEYSDPELLDDESPNQHKGLTKIQEPPFLWIKEKPIITRYIERDIPRKNRKRGQEQDVTTDTGLLPHTDTFSTGEAYGTSRNVAEALTHSKQNSESVDQLWGMWEAITKFAKQHKDIIKGVYHYDITKGLCNSGAPRLINFPLTRANQNNDGNNKKSVYKNGSIPQRFPVVYGKPPKRRGLLLVKISLYGAHFYILEIQQRTDIAGESFAGLAFTVSPTDDFNAFLLDLIERVKSANGHVSSLAANWKNGKAIAYRHLNSKDNRTTMPENTVRIIFNKMSAVLDLNITIDHHKSALP